MFKYDNIFIELAVGLAASFEGRAGGRNEFRSLDNFEDEDRAN